MREQTVYVCEFCAKEYKSKNDCQRCKDKHKRIEEIGNLYYEACAEYPHHISVRFSDGRTLPFERRR